MAVAFTNLFPIGFYGLVGYEVLGREEGLEDSRLVERLEPDEVLDGVEQVVDDDVVPLRRRQHLVHLRLSLLLVGGHLFAVPVKINPL